MEGQCIVPYIIVHICVRGRAHGRVVEGGRLHAKDKIIRISILQAGSGLRNVVETDEVGDGRIQTFVVIILAVHGAQTGFIWPNCGRFMDTTQKDFIVGSQTVNTASRVS